MDLHEADEQREARPLARVIVPFRDELEKQVAPLNFPRALLEQMQKRELAPGVVELEDHILLRIDLPLPNEGFGLQWQRVDVLLSPRLLFVAQPRSLDEIDHSLDKVGSSAKPGELLVGVARSVLEGFDFVREGLQRETKAIQTSTTASRKTLRILHEDVDELRRGAKEAARALNEVLGYVAMDEVARADLDGAIDRLRAMEDVLQSLDQRMPPTKMTLDEEIQQNDPESSEIVETAITLGQRRLQRLSMGHAVTALIGGLAVSFGAAAMSWAAGPVIHDWGYEKSHAFSALAFPIGFIILIIGKGELFTENFFVPVTGVVSGKGKVGHLLELWGLTLVFNLIGAAIFAALISRPGVLADGAREFMNQVGHHKVTAPLGASFMKAIFAGWLMTLLTWMTLAAKEHGPKMFVIWIIGFMLTLGSLNHVVISAAECFIAMGTGSGITVKDWFFASFLPALAGNLVGGLVFVTLLGWLQARFLKHGEERVKKAFHEGDLH